VEKVRNIDLVEDNALDARDLLVQSPVSSVDVNHVTGEYVVAQPFHCSGGIGGCVTLHSQSSVTGILGDANASSYVFQSIPEHNVLSYPLDAKIDCAHGSLWIADSGNNRALKISLESKNAECTVEELCVFPTCVVPNINTGGAFILGYYNFEVMAMLHVDASGKQREVFLANHDMPVESVGNRQFDGGVIVLDANGDSSVISRVSLYDAIIDYNNVSSNPTHACMSSFSGDLCVLYADTELVEFRFPDGSRRGHLNVVGASAAPPCADNFSKDFWVCSHLEDFGTDIAQRLRFDPEKEFVYPLSATTRMAGVIAMCMSSSRRYMYVLYNDGATIAVYDAKGYAKVYTIDLSAYGIFASMKEDMPNGDILVLRNDGKMILRIVKDTVHMAMSFLSTVIDFSIADYVRVGTKTLYLLSNDGVNSCIQKVEYDDMAWSIVDTLVIPSDTYRRIAYSQQYDKLWMSSTNSLYGLYWRDGSSQAYRISDRWANIQDIVPYNYWSGYFYGLPSTTESSMPITQRACYDHVRDRIWWLASPKVYMADLRNKQVISQDMSQYGCLRMFGMDVEYGTGNVLFSMDALPSLHYIVQVNKDNTDVLGMTYLPARSPSYGNM
jgi:hypothetical protein